MLDLLIFAACLFSKKKSLESVLLNARIEQNYYPKNPRSPASEACQYLRSYSLHRFLNLLAWYVIYPQLRKNTILTKLLENFLQDTATECIINHKLLQDLARYVRILWNFCKKHFLANKICKTCIELVWTKLEKDVSSKNIFHSWIRTVVPEPFLLVNWKLRENARLEHFTQQTSEVILLPKT